MLSKTFCMVALIGISFSTILAQSIQMSGTVKNASTGLALEGASVRLIKQVKATTTSPSGTFSFSGPLSMRSKTAINLAPTMSIVGNSMVLDLNTNTDFSLIVQSINGKVVFQNNQKLEPGRHSVEMPLTGSGMYFYTIKVNENRYRMKHVQIHSDLTNSPSFMKITESGEWILNKTAAVTILDTLQVTKTGFLPLLLTVDNYVATGLNLFLQPAEAPKVDAIKESKILGAIADLKKHIAGSVKLDSVQISIRKLIIDSNATLFGSSPAVMKSVMDLVSTYDSIVGPLWVGSGTLTRSAAVNNLTWTIYNVMQNTMDSIYTDANIQYYSGILNGFKFKSSNNFPGAVTPPLDSNATYSVKINGSFPKTFGHTPTQTDEGYARKPTGTYLAPGSIATVTVPLALVGKGYQVRVGAHSWDNGNRPRLERLDRVSLTYAINSTQVKVANPLGGGIYIEVPYLANAGINEVTVKNVVRSPYFSAKSFHTTTLAEWQNTERNFKAPWADFQTEKFMMNLPTTFIYKWDNPAATLAKWDTAMDVMNDLMGYPHMRGKESMYPQIDLQNRSSVFAPGYPSVNNSYDPLKDYGGNANTHYLKGPEYSPDFEFHERGHAYFFIKYGGEKESTVNLLHVAVMNQKFGFSLDSAFRTSRGEGNSFRTLDHTAIAWMTCFNFAPNRQPMEEGEKAYQLKGHAKFVEIARLFGWKVVNDLWYSINEDFEKGILWNPPNNSTDDRITLRLSQKAGFDLRPLIHFWGVPPTKPDSLKMAIAASNLPPSAKIYDMLLKYKVMVPANNAEFQAFSLAWFGHIPKITGLWEEREHARQWDTTALYTPPVRPNGEIYNEASAADTRNAVQEIIDLYFPKGRP